MSTAPLPRPSIVDAMADALRARILEGELAPGTRLREVDLAEQYGVSRHTLRAAVRQLAVEGLVTIEPQRGASVARLDATRLVDLFALRTALEMEAAHLALERGDGRLPPPVHRSLEQLVRACRASRPSWQRVAALHAALHGAIVAASESPRIVAAYDALATEMRLFLMQLRPVWSFARMGPHHEALIADLESIGEPALRAHLADGLEAVLGDSSEPSAGPPPRNPGR